MTQQNAMKIFEERKVRSVWDEETEEGNETVTTCHAFKMPAADGKMRKTDVATVEQLFRLIQSIPSPKAEPFKLWIARVAAERLDQMADPELSIEQAMTDYKRLGDQLKNDEPEE